MKNIFLLCVLSALFAVNSSASSQFYNERKAYAAPTYVEQNPFVIKNNYVFVAGSAKVFSSRKQASIAARHSALKNLSRLKEQEFDFSNQFPILKKNIFIQYQTVSPIRFSAENAIVIADYSRQGKYYYAAAYRLDDIKFIPQEKLSFEKIYLSLKQASGKRDELLFFEIIPDHDMPALKDAVENNIAKQYGKNFALMFAGKDVPAITQKKYDAVKETYKNYNSKTAFKALVIAANALPYDKKICTLLAEKFAAMQMPRCSDVMRKRANESSKLVIEQEPEEQPESQDKDSTEKAVSASEVKNIDTSETPQAEQTPKQDPQIERLLKESSDKKTSEDDVEQKKEKQTEKPSSESKFNFLNFL